MPVAIPLERLSQRRSNSSTSAGDDHDEPLLPGGSPRARRGGLAKWLWSRPRAFLRGTRRIKRYPKSFLRLALKYLLCNVVAVLVITPLFFPSYTRLPPHYKALRARCAATGAPGCANPRNEKVFITASLYDPSGKLARGAWGEAVVELIRILGDENVFLSIYENDSGVIGSDSLKLLEKKVTCKKSIWIDGKPNYKDFPHVEMPDSSKVLKRLAYLTEMRNRALYPLDRFRPDEEPIMKFDKILFLNDAIFNPLDAAHLLLNTNADPSGETHYLSACALDYDHNPLLFYDLYAQRDAEGFSNGIPIFPYFSTAGHAASRTAILSRTDAVPVKSCWGGMVAMRAHHLQHLDLNLPSMDWRNIAHHVIDPSHPRNVTAPVRFRYEPEIYFDACECCLLQADVQAVALAAGDHDTGVFVNPYIRVAYHQSTLRWVHFLQAWELLLALPQRIAMWFAPLPTPNPHREVQQGELFREEVYGAKGWEMVERRGRNGMFCGVREMQTVVEDRDRFAGAKGQGSVNWKDHEIPWRDQKLYFPP